jgi:tRNA threonylcarbamoyladenosine biosynthesis protein TsaB
MMEENKKQNKKTRILYFDTADRDKIIIGLGEKYWEFTNREQKAQDLVGLIEETLKKEKTSLDEIKGIEVNLGPGSFTGLRIGVAVANALGFALDIPVNGRRKLVLPKYEKYK